MKVESLGHVVLKVSDLERSEQFYNGVLGMDVCARFDEQGMKMIFFSLGNHHDLALAEVSGDDAAAGEQAAGLHHVAFCIGKSLDELVKAGLLTVAQVNTLFEYWSRDDAIAANRTHIQDGGP